MLAGDIANGCRRGVGGRIPLMNGISFLLGCYKEIFFMTIEREKKLKLSEVKYKKYWEFENTKQRARGQSSK